MLTIVRVGLWLLPFRTLRRLLERYAGRPGADDGSSIERVRDVVRVVTAVARRWPGATTCLVDALAADAMLRRRGYASQLCFGVRPPGSGAKRLEGHAWIEHRGTVVLGELDRLGDYAVMSPPSPWR